MKIAAGAVLGAILVAVSGAAVGQDKANGPPFWVGQHSWPSKQAFMDSGARCGTRPLSDIERATVEEKIGPLVAAIESGDHRYLPASQSGVLFDLGPQTRPRLANRPAGVLSPN